MPPLRPDDEEPPNERLPGPRAWRGATGGHGGAARPGPQPRRPAGAGGWATGLIGQHPGAANALIATGQLLLAPGIAWRPAVRVALAASVAWALGGWWLGEGLGGVLSRAAA